MNHRRLLLLILAAYLIITIAYSVVNPLFEAPDELWHYFTAQTIADNGRLPIVAETYDVWMSQEAAQPPLHYLLSAFIIRQVETGDARAQVWRNPFFPQGIGNAAALSNRNAVIHTSAEAWPWQGVPLAAHLLRLLSTLFGLGTLLCIYATGRRLWPDDPAIPLTAVALTAFLPQFAFQHAAVSNDTLITFLASLALWQLVRLWQTPPGQTRRRALIGLGVAIGLAALTKNSGVLLAVYAVGLLGWRAWRHGRLRRLLEIGLFVALPILLIAGWLWQRNWALYGDPTAANQFIRIAGGDRAYTTWQVLAETPSLWVSLFAIFGWFNVRPPDWVLWLWNGLVFGGVLGMARPWWNRRPRLPASISPAFLLALWPLAVYAGLFQFMLKTPAAQGRLLFPAIAPLSLGLAWGWRQWRFSGWGTAVLPALALFTALYSLIFVIPPAYAPPPTLTALPPEAAPLSAAWANGLELVGARLETETAVPGDPVWLTLYWRRGAALVGEPEPVIELFGRGNQLAGKLHSYPGRGLYPASLWPPETVVADRVGFYVAAETAAPALARLLARQANGAGPVVLAGQVKITPTSWPKPAGEPLVVLGDAVGLTAVSLNQTEARPGETISLTVQWQALAAPGRNWTTLAHLGQAGQEPLATGDAPPLNGDYPTGVWAAGEVIDDRYTLMIPPDLASGRYPVWIGLYDRQTLARAPLLLNGARQPHDVFLAGWVTVQ